MVGNFKISENCEESIENYRYICSSSITWYKDCNFSDKVMANLNLRKGCLIMGAMFCVFVISSFFFHGTGVTLVSDPGKDPLVSAGLLLQRMQTDRPPIATSDPQPPTVKTVVKYERPVLNELMKVLVFVMNLRSLESRVFSQNQEDGVLEAIFRQIGEKHKYFVEFGVEAGKECNSRIFRERHAWKGLMMDGSHQNDRINLKKEMIYPNNIVKLFQKYGVPMKFDLLSVDTDFKDFWLVQKILAAGYRPRVIVSEINSFLGPNVSKTVPLDWSETMGDTSNRFYGYSVKAGWILGRYYNYSMVYCESRGVNCIYVIDGEEGFGKGIRVSNYLNGSSLWQSSCCLQHKPDRKNRPYTTITENTIFE